MVMNVVPFPTCLFDFETGGSRVKAMESFAMETNFLWNNFLILEAIVRQQDYFLCFVKLVPSWV